MSLTQLMPKRHAFQLCQDVPRTMTIPLLLKTMKTVPFGCTHGAGLLVPKPCPALDTFAEYGFHGPVGSVAVKKSIVAAEDSSCCTVVCTPRVAELLQWWLGCVPHGDNPFRQSCVDSRDPVRGAPPLPLPM